MRQQLSLDALSKRAGVSRSMLSQVEGNLTNPTFAILWKLASALDVGVAEILTLKQQQAAAPSIDLLPAHSTPVITNADGACLLRIIGPVELAGKIEWYELTIQPGGVLASAPHEKVRRNISRSCQDNPDVVEQVLAQLPLKSVLGHVVVSGEAIWIPTRIVHLGRNNMVQRHPGAVYLYAPGQTICLTYGKITESANVNKFAEVFQEDFATLQELGELVYEHTVALPRRTVIRMHRWIHFIFRRNLGVSFPHRLPAEVQAFSKFVQAL